ncbi:MAG: hypothetical protein ACAI43_21665 [Phycisphaerae bacterium]
MPDSPLKPAIEGSAPAPAPLNLDYARPRSFGERVRDRLPSADRTMSVLKNLLVVVPLTLLIWVYAEREQAVTVPGNIFPVEVRTTAPDRVVVLRWPADHNLIVELSGPRGKMDEVRQKLLPGAPGSAPVQLLIDPQLGTGPQELETAKQLNLHPLFKNNGITVKSCQPPYIKVDIDVIEERDAVVKVPPQVAANLENVTFVPRVVKIRAPKRLLDAAEQAGELSVWADLSKREELKKRTGTVELKNVPLYWDHREFVTLSAPVADANVVIKTADVAYTIPTVAVMKVTPNKFEDTNTLEFSPTFPNVGVVGPADQIQAIKDGKFTVQARFVVSTLNHTVGQNKARLQFDLPPNVKLSEETVERAGAFNFTMGTR